MRAFSIIPEDINSRPVNAEVGVLDAAEASALDPDGFVEPILWGWKRDAEQPDLSRTVYFSARHVRCGSGTHLEHPFLFYSHWGPEAMMAPLVAHLAGNQPQSSPPLHADFEILTPVPGITHLRIISGRPQAGDMDRLGRLTRRRPDHPVPTPPMTRQVPSFDLRESGITGCDLLAGSGLSYESGLPTLKEVHDLFWVDDGYDNFCLGARDRLPELLHGDLAGMFRRFASWHVQAARAKPSGAHRSLRQLREAGFLHHVYTDNIDRLFAVAGIDDAVQVRGSGVVNEVYPTQFHPDSNALLVVGVSADRRGIIAQARRRGLKIAVINPYLPVSPRAKNLDYLEPDDIYFRLRAGEALPSIVSHTVGAT